MAESLTSDLDQEFTKSKVSNQVAHLFGKNENRLSEVIARFFSKTTGAQPSIYNKDIKQWSIDLQDVISSLGINDTSVPSFFSFGTILRRFQFIFLTLDKTANEMVHLYKYQIASIFQTLYTNLANESRQLTQSNYDNSSFPLDIENEMGNLCRELVDRARESYDMEAESLEASS